jgi:hypothetical protein
VKEGSQQERLEVDVVDSIEYRIAEVLEVVGHEVG